MDSVESRVRTKALNHGYDAEELYVHIPSRGKGNAHIELEDEYSNIPSDISWRLMKHVDISDEQVATKHKLLDVLEEDQ